jgi:multisubunit Na+/H+ antiporter MnhC subunit
VAIGVGVLFVIALILTVIGFYLFPEYSPFSSHSDPSQTPSNRHSKSTPPPPAHSKVNSSLSHASAQPLLQRLTDPANRAVVVGVSVTALVLLLAVIAVVAFSVIHVREVKQKTLDLEKASSVKKAEDVQRMRGQASGNLTLRIVSGVGFGLLGIVIIVGGGFGIGRLTKSPSTEDFAHAQALERACKIGTDVFEFHNDLTVDQSALDQIRTSSGPGALDINFRGVDFILPIVENLFLYATHSFLCASKLKYGDQLAIQHVYFILKKDWNQPFSQENWRAVCADPESLKREYSAVSRENLSDLRYIDMVGTRLLPPPQP